MRTVDWFAVVPSARFRDVSPSVKLLRSNKEPPTIASDGPPAFEGRLIKQQRISAKDTDAGWNYLLTSIVTTDYVNGTTTTETVDYDAIGNPTTYRGASLAFNGRQLTSYTKGSTSISYTYDASGLRASKTVNGETTIYQYVGDKLYYEQRADGSKHYYFYDSYGNLAKIYRHTNLGKKVYNVVTNAQGDVIALYDYAGVLVCTYEYDAWGNLTFARNSAGNVITSQNHIAFLNPIRYRGYYFDNEIGMYYLQSRYYDPDTGRFINADGYITTGQGVLSYNMFAYCLNNPVNLSDPSGEWPTWEEFVDWLDEKEENFKNNLNYISKRINSSGRAYVSQFSADIKNFFTPERVNTDTVQTGVDVYLVADDYVNGSPTLTTPDISCGTPADYAIGTIGTIEGIYNNYVAGESWGIIIGDAAVDFTFDMFGVLFVSTATSCGMVLGGPGGAIIASILSGWFYSYATNDARTYLKGLYR